MKAIEKCHFAEKQFKFNYCEKICEFFNFTKTDIRIESDLKTLRDFVDFIFNNRNFMDDYSDNFLLEYKEDKVKNFVNKLDNFKIKNFFTTNDDEENKEK